MQQKSYHRDTMPTGDGHQIYYELSGNPEGVPVLVIHGGPGAGLSPNYTDAFDLAHYHVIGFDQRGCGRSTPFLSLSNNTTPHLLEDISRLRRLLGIHQWILFGGSWGTTLALLAAINEPHTIKGMILRGIFLARHSDFTWFLAPDGGAAQIYPDAYQQFVANMPESPADMTAVLSYFKHAFESNNLQLKQQAAHYWYRWEEAIAKVYPTPVTTPPEALNPAVMSLAILEWHYVINHCFIDNNTILHNSHKLAGIPGRIIHGRCDTVCKPEGALALHQSWLGSELQLIPGAGHSSSEEAISIALRNATSAFKSIL